MNIVPTISEFLKNSFELHLRLFVSSCLLILTFITTTNAQWSTQSPVPTNLNISGIGAVSSNRIFISTDDNSFDNIGSLFESTDAGNSWTPREIPISLSSPFYGLFFLDDQYGWLFGNDIYSTTDSGTTWAQLPSLGSTYFMEFYTPNFGIASGNFETYLSKDGGLSWEPSPHGIFTFDFIDNQNGIGISDSGIYKTIDGGNTFSLVQSGSAEAVNYLSNSIVVAVVDGMFLRSTDGGTTWTTITSAQGRNNLEKVSADVALAWGRTGNFPDFDDRVFRSTDGGQSWNDLGEILNASTYYGSFAFTVSSEQNIVATDGSGNMYHSMDAGLNWLQTFSTPGSILPFYLGSAVPVFADVQTGYFGYGPGFIIKTTDGGANWFQISSGTGNTLIDIAGFPNGNMIAVGESGTLLTNQTGSSIWSLQSGVTQSHLKAVQVLNPTDVVIVDDLAKVYKSSDSGLSWIAASNAPTELSSVEDIHFNNLQDGWLIGYGFGNGALFHTTDGGANWNPIPDLLGGYISLDVEGSNLWAANVTGLYYRSTDNGNTWTEGNLPDFPFNIQDMDFFDANIGYAVGWGGQAFRSADGGATWQVLPTPNSNDQLTDLYIVGPNEFWISTNSNKAYYSANGGQGWALLDIGSTGFGSFSSIYATPAGDAWAVGYQGFIEHFSGTPPPPLNQFPTAAFDYDINGLTVSFTDQSTDLDGSIVSWSWDFGDGIFSSEQNSTHTYDTANTYIARLKVTDDDGATDSTIRILTVQSLPGGTFGDFTEVTPIDSIFVTPEDEDFWVITTAPADYDGDGDLDIAVLGYYVVYNQSVEDRLLLLINNGPIDSVQWNFDYVNISLGTLTTGASDMAWGDVDGDGDLDLAVGTDGATIIYRNDVGTLEMSDSILPGYWEENSQADFDIRSITWADYDNDGDLDLLIPSTWDENEQGYRTSLMRNDGPNGTGGWIFTQNDSAFAPAVHAQSAWADFDNDQDLDLLLINIAPLTDDGFIRRYRNDGNGVFVGEDILGSLSVEHGEGQWGDYDGDGDMDILVAGNIKEIDGTYTHMALRIYRNDEENYVPVDVIDCIPCEGWFDLTAATWADYDSDGDMDILLAGTHNPGTGNIEGRARIYTNNNGVFTESGNELPAPRAAGDRGGTFSWLDIDGEGDLDYFIAGQYFVPGGNGLVEAQMHVYRNDSPGQNNAPFGPTYLNAVVQLDSTVLLTWTPSSDDHTPTPAITYDIVIVRKGTHTPTRPGDDFNFNSASPITRLPEPGNISAVTQWLLTGLQDGLYDWNLRAVDAAYVGSTVATGTFQIGGTTSVETDIELPIEFSLEQNYPNPFNPSTKIRYAVPQNVNSEKTNVSLIVYDILGNEIATLVNEQKTPGFYEVNLNASSFASGVYFYRIAIHSDKIQAGSFVETKKMILMK